MKKLLVIVGPTGTGKTKLAIDAANKFNGEIVSADSRQIYKGMDIGTGKLDVGSKTSNLRKEEGCWIVGGVPIYLYDIITPDKTFSMVEFQQAAYERIHKIHETYGKNKSLSDLSSGEVKLPILVGGTGLYVRAVVQGLKVPQAAPDKKIRHRLEKKSLGALLKDLEGIDPKTYQKIDKSNPRRVIRALEIFYKTGVSKSSQAKKYKPDFDILQVGLISSREVMYQKADERIDKWLENGFVDEVKKLLKKYDSSLPSMSSLGYRQIASYLDKEISLEEAAKRIKFDHHGYIRRQVTWFKKEPDIFWFDVTRVSYKEGVLKMISKWLAS